MPAKSGNRTPYAPRSPREYRAGADVFKALGHASLWLSGFVGAGLIMAGATGFKR